MVWLKWSKGISGVTLLAVLFLLVGRACSKRANENQSVVSAPTLKDEENEKVIVDLREHKVTHVFKEGEGQSVRVVNGVRQTSLVLGEDGKLRLTSYFKGWCFEPGLGVSFSDKPRGLVDVQIAFYRDYGLNVGISVDGRGEFRTLIMGSYRIYSNTSIVVGIDHKKEFNIGLRVAL